MLSIRAAIIANTTPAAKPDAKPVEYKPSVYVLSSGEVTPFTAIFRAPDDETEGRVRAAFVEAARAAGLVDEARAAARVAVGSLRQRAASLRDQRLARCFLQNVPEHARLMALAAELGAD